MNVKKKEAKTNLKKILVSRKENWGQDYPIDERIDVIQLIERNRGPNEDWDQDYPLDEKKPPIKFNDIPPQDRLKFAKRILSFMFILFLVILTVTYCFPDNPQTEKVWSFSAGAINSIISILIGYYFISRHD